MLLLLLLLEGSCLGCGRRNGHVGQQTEAALAVACGSSSRRRWLQVVVIALHETERLRGVARQEMVRHHGGAGIVAERRAGTVQAELADLVQLAGDQVTACRLLLLLVVQSGRSRRGARRGEAQTEARAKVAAARSRLIGVGVAGVQRRNGRPHLEQPVLQVEACRGGRNGVTGGAEQGRGRHGQTERCCGWWWWW